MRTFWLSVVGLSSVPAFGMSAFAAEPTPLQKVQEAAQACSVAAISGDDKKVVSCTLPQVVKRVGGTNAMLDLLRNGREQLRAEKRELLSVNVYAPDGFISGRSTGDTYAILKSHTAMKVATGTLHQSSYLIAVSTDKMKSWRFIEGVGLDDQKIKDVLPSFPSSVKLPASEEAVLE